MPGVIGQIGQSVADNLYEIGQSAVKATADVVPGVAKESLAQLLGEEEKKATGTDKTDNTELAEQRKAAARNRLEEVRSEMATYVRRRQELEKKIAEEKMVQQQEQQEKMVKKQEKESWAKRIINRAATTTERGRMAE